MGYQFGRRPLNQPYNAALAGGILASTKGSALSTASFTTAGGFAVKLFFKTTAAVIANRVVKMGTAGVKHTTGSSGRKILGVALQGATAAGSTVQVLITGVCFVQVSSNAVARGVTLRATSGAASTSSRLGGTVRSSTNNTQNIVGISLTSAAAGTGSRSILAWITPIGRASTAA